MILLYIRKHVRKDGQISWYLETREYQGNKCKRTQIPKAKSITFGLPADLSFEQAVARAEQLNAQAQVKIDNAKKLAVTERMDRERVEAFAFLPQLDIIEFENGTLAPKFLGTDTWNPKHKLATKWRAAIKTMGAVKLDPSEWAEKPFLFYNHFLTQKFSPGYTERIIALMNLFGYFYCRKYKKAFFPLPPLKGILRIKQINAYKSKEDRRHKSDPISPAELEAAKSGLDLEQYNWVFLSLWLGLRPEEVDSLKSPKSGFEHYIEMQDDVPLLVVYQTKLEKSTDEADRWKRIPILYPEQEAALAIIESKQFKRPLPKTMQKHLGKAHADTYSGRKSFTDLMLGLGQRLEDIQGWLGHTSIERTWKDYKNRKKIHFIKPPKKTG